MMMPHGNIAGIMPQTDDVLTPQQALDQSSAVLFNLTGGRSPNILLFASCPWCAKPWTEPCVLRQITLLVLGTTLDKALYP